MSKQRERSYIHVDSTFCVCVCVGVCVCGTLYFRLTAVLHRREKEVRCGRRWTVHRADDDKMDFQKATRISSCFLVVVSSALVLASTLWTCSLDDGDNDDASATSSRFTRVLSGASSMPTWEIVLRSGGVIVLVFFSGCFAGLLLALMGPEKNHLLVSGKLCWETAFVPNDGCTRGERRS